MHELLKIIKMKLENLKSSKFEAFKENEITNTIKVLGGAATTPTLYGGAKDTYDYGSQKGGVYNEKDFKFNN
jgi:hypothetical protein